MDVKFEAGEIFKDVSLSFGLFSQPTSEFFNLTPTEFYSELKNLAATRYQYTLLPDNLSQIKCLESPNNKISLLRDICLSVGITLNLHGEQGELVLENDPAKMRQQLSLKMLNQRQSYQ